MARAEIDLIVNTVSTSTSRMSAGAGASVQVNARNADGTSGAAATVYTTATLGTTATNPLTADANGRITGWLDQGVYNFVVSGTGITTFTQAWDSTPSVGVTAGAGAIGTTQLIDNSVTSVKLASDASVDANRAVQTNHIRDAQITTPKVQDGAVTAQKLASTSVTLAKRATTPYCRLFHSVDQTVTASSTLVLDWNSETYDTDTMHGNANTTRITFTTAGVYVLFLQIGLTGTFGSNDVFRIRLNGTTTLVETAPLFDRHIQTHYLATAGDFIEGLYITDSTVATRTLTNQNSGSSSTYFTAYVVSP